VNYSAASICNLALGRIGARGQIVSLDENSPNAIKCLAVWDAIFQEVLSTRDWKFAKTRQQLQLSDVTPLYTWRYAWALPSDFLRFVRPRRRQISNDYFFWSFGPESSRGWYSRQDPPFWPHGWDYRVETLTAGWKVTEGQTPVAYPGTFPAGKYLLTNYNGLNGEGPNLPAAITYIQLITDYSQLMPGFVNCLAYRLAQELCIGVTEDKGLFLKMSELYKESLNSAEAQNETMDYEQDEDGSESWINAGRWVERWM
jgi:hypothetical protein